MKKRDPHVVLGVEPGASPADGQGGLAPARPGQPPRPERRRSGRRPGPRPPGWSRSTRPTSGSAKAARPSAPPAPQRAGGKSTRPTADAAAFDASGTRRRHGRAAAAPADPAGDRPSRHQRDAPPAQPDDDPAGAATRTARSAGTARSASRPAGRGPANLGPRRASIRPARCGAASSPQLPGTGACPTLDLALATEMTFGKFHGHTLGQIAAFEPSYIDWVSGTITRDPELVAAARVVRASWTGGAWSGASARPTSCARPSTDSGARAPGHKANRPRCALGGVRLVIR